MNRVAAFALLFLKEEDAFWCLVCIIDFIMPQDYFSISMVAAQADQVMPTYYTIISSSVNRQLGHDRHGRDIIIT